MMQFEPLNFTKWRQREGQQSLFANSNCWGGRSWIGFVYRENISRLSICRIAFCLREAHGSNFVAEVVADSLGQPIATSLGCQFGTN